MNLFLASYRFERPLTEIYRSTAPFICVLLVALLLVTYWPSLVMGMP
jgi:TRAP-type C4-dicarboxylate transport system permease large subunit